MKTNWFNILAIPAGWILGSALNMGILLLGNSVVPPPEGMDFSNAESIKEHIHLFEFKHFVFPFLAHALGTFAGAATAGLIAKSRILLPIMVVGGLFLAGGVLNFMMIPAPQWFMGLDLFLAYIPMAYFAYWLLKTYRFKQRAT